MSWGFHPVPKPVSRLRTHAAAKKVAVVDARTFRIAVWERDKGHCRCCGREVVRTTARLPQRGEIHHCHGRLGPLAFEERTALLLCLACHERVTGKVNDRLFLVGTKFLTLRGKANVPMTCLDARAAVRFEALEDD